MCTFEVSFVVTTTKRYLISGACIATPTASTEYTSNLHFLSRDKHVWLVGWFRCFSILPNKKSVHDTLGKLCREHV